MASSRLTAFLLHGFFTFFLLVLPVAANAQSGISLKSSIPDANPPSRWLAMIPGTDRYVADKRDAWGFLEVAPGNYDLLVVPAGDNALPIDFGRVSVTANQVSEINLDSGIRLNSSNDLEPLPWWFVVDIAKDESVAQVQERWGFTPLPPGRYRLEAPTSIQGYMGTRTDIEIREGDVIDVELAELNLRQLAIDMPAKPNVRLAFGGLETIALLELGGEFYRLSDEGGSEETIELWIAAEPVAIERLSGSFVDRVEIEGRSGERVEIPFDPEQIAKDRGLSLIDVRLKEHATSIDRLTIVDHFANKLLLSEVNPSLDGLLLAPGGIQIRASIDDTDVNYGAVPVGGLSEIELNVAKSTDEASATLDVVVETPEDGDTFEPETGEVTIVGHASTTSAAGTTKIALVIDTSGSTNETSGADLDGDGDEETILEAEVAAALELVDALLAQEAKSPGTAFALSVIRFGETADAVTPMLRLTEARDVALLRNALRNLLSDRSGGDTYYDRALDTALRVFEATDSPGPEVVLFVSDGKPTQLVPGLDAAARVGRHGAIIHAVGLGPDFKNVAGSTVNYPPGPENGVDILATVAALGHAGGEIWPLPKPADIVKIVPELPVLERPDANIEELQIENTTIKEQAVSINLSRDGSFEAVVPVRFARDGASSVNKLHVVAKSLGGQLTASDLVRVQAEGFESSILETIQKDADAVRAQNFELAEKVDVLELQRDEEAASHTAEITRLQEQHRAALSEQRDRFESELQERASAEDALKAAKGDVAAAQGMITELEHQLSKEKQAAELRLASLRDDYQVRLQETERALKSIDETRAQAELAKRDLEAELAEADEHFTAQLARLEEERDAAKKSLESLMAKHDRDLDEQGKLLDEARRRLAATDESLAAVRDDLVRSETQVAGREREVEELSRKLQDGEAANDQCERVSSKCKADLKLATTKLFQIDVVPEAIILNVESDILFDFDSSVINPGAEDTLRLASAFIEGHPRSNLIVEGHTDGIGSEDYNQELSVARAEAVTGWLVESGGLAPERIEAVGFGETNPVASERTNDGGDDPEGRQRNRRVTIKILK